MIAEVYYSVSLENGLCVTDTYGGTDDEYCVAWDDESYWENLDASANTNFLDDDDGDVDTADAVDNVCYIFFCSS